MADPDEPQLTEAEHIMLDYLRGVVDRVVEDAYAEEYEGLTQESPLTATIAAKIENELTHHPVTVDDVRVDVTTRNVPDRGRGSLEKKIGADLYISVVRTVRGQAISKGILVQAKWIDDVKTAGDQAADMEALTDESYLLIYGKDRSPVVVKTDDIDFSAPRLIRPRGISVGRLITDGLRCERGDRAIGRRIGQTPKRGMDDVLRELAAKRALDLTMTDRPAIVEG